MFGCTRCKRKRILALFNLLGPHQWVTASQIIETNGMLSGTIYPILMKLENEKVIESQWADGPEPRKRVYRKILK